MRVPDGDGAVFGCWRESEITYTWQRQRDDRQKPTQAEIQTLRDNAAQARAQAQAEREAGYQEAAVKAHGTWQNATEATAHPYPDSKGHTGTHGTCERHRATDSGL